MLREMTLREFAGWWHYAQIEPFGEQRADLRMGIHAAANVNCHRDRKRRPKPYEASDFIPVFHRPKKASNKPVTTKEQFQEVKRVALMMAGGKAKTGGQ